MPAALSAQLNKHQRAAVRHLHGPLLVLAGAGTGKTRVITSKIARLIQQYEVNPEHVFAVTFTNKAAREMKARVAKIVGVGNVPGLTVSTFHRLGLNILRAHCADIGLRSGFSLLAPEDSALVVRELMRTELSAERDLAEAVRQRISWWKNDAVTVETVSTQDLSSPIDQAAARVYPQYERQIRACNAVDLDDLLLLPVRLLLQNEDCLRRWQDRVRYMLVDEYQDTNSTQYQLVKLLVATGKGLTVVGDDDQSIYAWRGARPENLKQLQQDFPELEVIKLEQNYRSVNRILGSANALIGKNLSPFRKTLWSSFGHGDAITVLVGKNETHEAERVVASLMHHRFQRRAHYRDYAILYRGNHQSRWFEQKLREMRIPYRISGGTSFFDRAEIRDMLAYLRLITNLDDDTALMRIVNVPRRGIGPGTLEKLGGLAQTEQCSLLRAALMPRTKTIMTARQWGPLRQFATLIEELNQGCDDQDPVLLLETLLRDIEYEAWLHESAATGEAATQRVGNVHDFVDWVRHLQRDDPEQGLSALVATMTLQGMLDRDQDDDDGDDVSLMTLHAAKGLEFPYVYIVGVEEDRLPHHNSVASDNIEEERRLFYVGITRAQQRLCLSLANQRQRFGEIIDCVPSRFLEELPPENLDWVHAQTTQNKDNGVGAAHLAAIRDLLR